MRRTARARWMLMQLMAGCADDARTEPTPTSAELAPPAAPDENPTTPEKVELGRHLFHDVRLSRERNVSCATCHQQARAFADDVAFSRGTTGVPTARNSMSLVNSAYAATLTWFNPLLHDFEGQALVPLVGESPVELGMSNGEALLRARLMSEPRYEALFGAAFPRDSEPYTLQNVAAALSSFQRTLVSTRAPYDAYLAGDAHALDDAARAGLVLFSSERLGCTHCHGGRLFSSAMSAPEEGTPSARFENNGLRGDFPPEHYGLFELTGKAGDLGKYKPPTLRNVALTAPYMHDGSLATLDDVLDHYARGGQTSATRSPHITGFTLDADERAALLAFLSSLSDEALTTDPRFASPWE